MKLVDKALICLAKSSEKTTRSIGDGYCWWVWSYKPKLPEKILNDRKMALEIKEPNK